MTSMFPQLDLDRLHTVTETINSGANRQIRSVGYTTAYLHLMLGEVELGDRRNTYIYVGESSQHAVNIMYQFWELLEHIYGDQAAAKQQYNCLITEKSQRFFFCSPKQLPTLVTGRSVDRIFIDVADWASDDFFDVHISLVSRNGDFL